MRCRVEGCKTAAQGSSSYCTIHGGGPRCYLSDVHIDAEVIPSAYAKIDGIPYCWSCANHINPSLFKWKPRKEILILAEIQRRLPELEQYFVLWDCPVDGGCSAHRPDMLWDFFLFWFSIEVDKNGHNQPPEKYKWISTSMGDRPGVLMRINPDKKGNRMFKRRHNKNGEKTYEGSKYFDAQMEQLTAAIKDKVIERAKRDEFPNGIEEIKMFF